MELRDIEYFTVVAEHGHLGRAAESLRLSQPALSKSLRRLERILDAKLVKRTPRGIELTPEGATLLARTRELRSSLQNVTREIADLGRGKVGEVRVGTGPMLAEQLFPASFLAVLEDAPRTRFTIVVSDNDGMIPALRRGELDLIVNYPPRTMSKEGLIEELLCEDEFVVVASSRHRLAKLRRVTIGDLAQERWVLSEPSLLAQQRLRQIFQECGFSPPQVALETRSVQLKLETVAASNLLDYTSRRVVAKLAQRYTVKILPIKALTWRRPVSLIYREGAYLSPAVRRFSESLRMTAQRL